MKDFSNVDLKLHIQLCLNYFTYITEEESNVRSSNAVQDIVSTVFQGYFYSLNLFPFPH